MENAKQKKNVILDNGMELIPWEEDAPVSICYHPKESLMTSTHWHAELELNCVFDGVMEYHVGGKRKVVAANGVCVVNSGEVHCGRVQTGTYTGRLDEVGFTIHFRENNLMRLLPGVEKLYFEIDSAETEQQLFLKMREIYCYSKNADDNISRLKCIISSYQLIALLYEKCRKNRDLVPINVQKDNERIKIIIEYLNDHCAEELKQQDLAKKFHFSREHFSRFFKKETGLTLKEYIVRYRIEKAEHLLKSTDKSLLEISLEVGFSSESQLIVWFKKLYCMTPHKYRQQIRMKFD